MKQDETFCEGTRLLKNIPPTQGALVQHVQNSFTSWKYIGTSVKYTAGSFFPNGMGTEGVSE